MNNKKTKTHKTKTHKTKTHKTKTHKAKTHKTKTHKKLNGGADYLGGLISTPGKKNYSVPGEKYTHLFNPNSYLSIKKKNRKNNKINQKLYIIFNRNKHNSIDITQAPNNTILYSNIVTKEPYLFINSMGKYLIVMYKEVIQNFVKIKLLYWLMGYINYNTKKIFHYIEPNVPAGVTADFTIKIYKLPNDYIDLNNVKINIEVNHNNIYNEIKLNKAYNFLFNTYLKPYKLLPVTNINFKVKGSSNQIVDIFSIYDKQHQKNKMAKYLH